MTLDGDMSQTYDCDMSSEHKRARAEAKAAERAAKRAKGMLMRSVWVWPGVWERVLPAIERENRRAEQNKPKTRMSTRRADKTPEWD